MRLRHRPFLPVRPLVAWAYGVAALVGMAPACATRQCPAEFGEKHPLVDFTGWAVLGLGVVLGVALMYYAFFRSRGHPWRIRLLALLGGAAGMVAIWFTGLLIAVNGFFLTC